MWLDGPGIFRFVDPKVSNILKVVNCQFPNVIRKCPNLGFSNITIPSYPRAQKLPEIAVLQPPHEEPLFGALVGNLLSFLCSKRFKKSAHSPVLISLLYSSAPSLFLWKFQALAPFNTFLCCHPYMEQISYIFTETSPFYIISSQPYPF